MRKNILTLIAMIFLFLLSSCGRDCQQEETVEPKDLVINIPEPCEYGSVDVYDEHVEEFSYTGKVEIVNDELVSCSCNCPYDGGICKHVAALLFATRDL